MIPCTIFDLLEISGGGNMSSLKLSQGDSKERLGKTGKAYEANSPVYSREKCTDFH